MKGGEGGVMGYGVQEGRDRQPWRRRLESRGIGLDGT